MLKQKGDGYGVPTCGCGRCYVMHIQYLNANPPDIPESHTSQQLYCYIMLSFLLDPCPAVMPLQPA